ncbi:phage tail sheath family protein [Brevibacillus composti]|uniref:Phage tail sheath family protein n=1 Tax=Brevibacillus composti TaxID=2796470 RepID=A0A7T5JQ31_9BACL|nr:phage tail sheath family protein [Brevibacillus composti]QQE75720.1 phage tail sheath family protein [Brevibacillus composti]QUO42746.1 phage tail sheath family protein [Brevibacillus composti]
MPYQHGVSINEAPTSVVSPVEASAGLPVVFGTAPLHLAETLDNVNKPVLVYTYPEAVKALGYADDWEKYTLCEFIDSHFSKFNVAPVVFVNVLDPETHKTPVANQSVPHANKVSTIDDDGVLIDTLIVKLTAEGAELVKGTDYVAAYDKSGKVVITAVANGAIGTSQTSLIVSYDKLNPEAVTGNDIIGGVDGTTGDYTGLELINKVFPMYRLVPGQILAPGWSQDPVVAAVMEAKAKKINGVFNALAVTDIDSSDTGADLYTEVPAWKNNNNYSDPHMVACWPKVSLGDKEYHLSTQFAGATCLTDAANDDIPYVSPSNKALQANGAVTASGKEVSLGQDQASYLNGEGIVTALNWIGGWRLWGNRTSAYPAITDVKDSFIPNRRMNNWIGNTIILTYWQFVDDPTNRKMIDTVVDSLNIWLNGLVARGALLGGRIEFRDDENPLTDLLDGIVRFHVYQASPVPGRQIDFILEYDVNYLQSLFAA